MRYTTQMLADNSTVMQAHQNEMNIQHGNGNNGGGYTDLCNHAVLDTDAHPLLQVVCYASRENALKLAGILNNATG